MPSFGTDTYQYIFINFMREQSGSIKRVARKEEEGHTVCKQSFCFSLCLPKPAGKMDYNEFILLFS